MPSRQDATSEQEIGIAVLQILANAPDGTATIQQLVDEAPKYVTLTDEDRQPSETRPNEELWEQRVRNIKSHRAVPGNLLHEGMVEDAGWAKMRISDAGRTHLKNKGLT